MKLNLKKGDNVKVITGKDSGKTGEILAVADSKVTVAGVNIQAHHRKPRNKDDKGGIIKSEGFIDISNVQLVCPSCKKTTRVAHVEVDGKSKRACKKCGATLDVVKKPAKGSKK